MKTRVCVEDYFREVCVLRLFLPDRGKTRAGIGKDEE